MNIAVIGATGTTGKLLVTQALENGHQVTALVRSPEKLDLQHPQLDVVVGDALNDDDVRKVMQGREAVFCALGTGESTKKSTIRQQGTQRIVDALHALDEAPHLVILSSLGVNESKQQMPWFVRTLVSYILRHPLADHREQELIVRNSTLPWTILRPTSLNDEAGIGAVHVTRPPQRVQAQPAVPRADVATFALETIASRKHMREAVTLTSPKAT